MNTDDISFADFLAFNAPPAAKPVDPWKLPAFAFVPVGVEVALERVARLHERAPGDTQSSTRALATVLLTGATVAQQRAAVRWLGERLGLPAFVVNAAELRDLEPAELDDLLAPLGEEIRGLFVIRNVDALPVTAASLLARRRPRSAFVLATSNEAVVRGDTLRAQFRTTIEWNERAHETARPRLSVTLATLLADCFERFRER